MLFWRSQHFSHRSFGSYINWLSEKIKVPRSAAAYLSAEATALCGNNYIALYAAWLSLRYTLTPTSVIPIEGQAFISSDLKESWFKLQTLLRTTGKSNLQNMTYTELVGTLQVRNFHYFTTMLYLFYFVVILSFLKDTGCN